MSDANTGGNAAARREATTVDYQEHVWEPAADGAASKEALDALQAAYYWEQGWREMARKVLVAAGRVA